MIQHTPIDPSEVPKHEFERAGWINIKLRLRGSSQSKLAKKLGVVRQTVGDCIHARKSERIDNGIADELGLKANQLFPERYAEDGSRLGGTKDVEPAPTSRAA